MEVSRESIFISALRAFCNAFFAFVGVIVGLVIIALILFGSFFKSATSHGLHTEMIFEANADLSDDPLPSTVPVIMRINIHGPIMPPNLTYNDIEVQLLDAQKGILKDGRIKGILLHMNTPGGSTTDAFAIYQMLMDYKKKFKVPIYAFTNGLCASAGVYITSVADKSFATDVSVIGSVGVILGPMFNYVGLMEKLGIKAKTISDGKNKDFLSPYRPWVEGEDKSLYAIAKSQYEHFVDLVTKSRPRLDKEKLINVYGAQVFSASVSQEYGFIDDGASTYNLALGELVKASGIEGDYQVIRLRPKRGLFSKIFEKRTIVEKVTSLFKSDETTDPVLYLYETP